MLVSAVSGVLESLGLDLVTVGGLVLAVLTMEWGFGIVRGTMERGITISTRYRSHTYRLR